jgi:hypothetical protein
MENPLYRSKSYFSGGNLAKFGPKKENSLKVWGCWCIFSTKKSFAPSHTRFVVELTVRKFAPQFLFIYLDYNTTSNLGVFFFPNFPNFLAQLITTNAH